MSSKPWNDDFATGDAFAIPDAYTPYFEALDTRAVAQRHTGTDLTDVSAARGRPSLSAAHSTVSPGDGLAYVPDRVSGGAIVMDSRVPTWWNILWSTFTLGVGFVEHRSFDGWTIDEAMTYAGALYDKLDADSVVDELPFLGPSERLNAQAFILGAVWKVPDYPKVGGYTRTVRREITSLSDDGDEGDVAAFVTNKSTYLGGVPGITPTDEQKHSGFTFVRTSGVWERDDTLTPDVFEVAEPEPQVGGGGWYSIKRGDIFTAKVANEIRDAINGMDWGLDTYLFSIEGESDNARQGSGGSEAAATTAFNDSAGLFTVDPRGGGAFALEASVGMIADTYGGYSLASWAAYGKAVDTPTDYDRVLQFYGVVRIDEPEQFAANGVTDLQGPLDPATNVDGLGGTAVGRQFLWHTSAANDDAYVTTIKLGDRDTVPTFPASASHTRGWFVLDTDGGGENTYGQVTLVAQWDFSPTGYVAP